jgi:hypothetical protein
MKKIDAIYNYKRLILNGTDYYGYSCNDGVKKPIRTETGKYS